MKKMTLLLITILSSVMAKAQVIALADGRFAIKNPKAKISGEGTGTCLAERAAGDGTGTCLAERTAGDGTGTCLAERTSGDGTGTCLGDSRLMVFDHPKAMTSKQVVELLNQTSNDFERQQIIELLKNEDQ